MLLFRTQRLKETHFELDIVQNIPHLQYIAGVIKGLIFLTLYYYPIMLTAMALDYFVPYFGKLTVIVSEAFFNSALIFLNNWPYDKFNAAFLEREKFYLLGYGMFTSIVCNCFLEGFTSLGAGIFISLWMQMNCVIYSPVEKPDGKQFESIGEIWNILTNSTVRNQLRNAYNLHRQRLVQNSNYRHDLILNTAFLVNPALKITEYLNQLIGKLLNKWKQQGASQPVPADPVP